MRITFDKIITGEEKTCISKWIEQHQPKTPQNILLECGEYVLTVVD